MSTCEREEGAPGQAGVRVASAGPHPRFRSFVECRASIFQAWVGEVGPSALLPSPPAYFWGYFMGLNKITKSPTLVGTVKH